MTLVKSFSENNFFLYSQYFLDEIILQNFLFYKKFEILCNFIYLSVAFFLKIWKFKMIKYPQFILNPINTFTLRHLRSSWIRNPINTPHVFHIKTTLKQLFPTWNTRGVFVGKRNYQTNQGNNKLIRNCLQILFLSWYLPFEDTSTTPQSKEEKLTFHNLHYLQNL